MRALLHVVVAGLFSLLPAFYVAGTPERIQQYRQRIGGVISELRNVLRDFDQDAWRSGLSREGALQLMDSKPEPFFRDRSTRYKGYETRLSALEKQDELLRQPVTPFTAWAFYRSYDEQIYKETMAAYKPALNLEGVLFGALAWLICMAVLGPVALLTSTQSRASA